MLDEIIRKKKERIEELKKSFDIAGIGRDLREKEYSGTFNKAISKGGSISLIAELKQASPSAGKIRDDFNAAELARAYEQGGVSAISILTEEHYFKGNLDYFKEVRNCVNIPLLQKDFFIDEYQIYQASMIGADCILLIAAILDDDKFIRLYSLARDVGLDALCEVHTEEELKRVLPMGVDIIGINNRDLKTFKVDIGVSEKLIPLIREKDRGITVVSESGFGSVADIARIKKVKPDALLVGESLMRSEDINLKLKEFKDAL